MIGDIHFTLPNSLDRWAKMRPEGIALTDGEREFAYAALASEVCATAARLAAIGVGSGDRVIVVGNNTCHWVIAYLATLRLGAISVPMNNRLTAPQVAELATLLEARVALADSGHTHLFQTSPALQLYGLGCRCGVGDLWDIRPADQSLLKSPSADMPAVISFTSGTTGIPKGAVLSHGALAAGSQVILNRVKLGPDDSTLVVAPLFHNIGFVDQLGQMLLCGGRTDLLTRYRTKEAIAAFERRPASFITAVPSVLRLLMTAEGADLVYGPARTVIFGGSPMPMAWSAELLTRWPQLRLWHGYGLTEFTSCCTLLPPELIESHGESIGYPPPEVELRLVDEAGQDVRLGEVGEIWVRGPTRMLGYWKRPDVTAEKLWGGWLKTGDLARTGDKNLLYHVGRKDDVINRGGEKVLPSFVESVLSERPDVAQCVVFGAPHPVLQSSVLAAIEPRPGHTFDLEAARRHLLGRLPDYAVPESILVCDVLPRTASGKIDRRAVRAAYLAKSEAHVKAR